MGLGFGRRSSVGLTTMKVLCSRAEAKCSDSHQWKGICVSWVYTWVSTRRIVVYSLSVGIHGHRGRGFSCQTRHFHPIPEAHWYPKAVERIGGIEQQAWNTIGHLVPCDMLSRFPHEPVLQSRRGEQTDLRKSLQ